MKIIILLLALLSMAPFTSAQTQTPARERTVEKDIDNTKDPGTSLRDQIESAPTASERNRLKLKLADLVLPTGQTSEPIAAYKTAIVQRNDKYSRAYNNLGVVLLRVGRWDEAYDAFLSA